MKKAGTRGRVAGSAAADAAGRHDWSRGAPGARAPALERVAPWSRSPAAWGVLPALSRAALARASVRSRLRTVPAVTSPGTRNTGRPTVGELRAGPGAWVAASWPAPPPPASPTAVVRLLDWLRNGTTRAASSRAAAAPQAAGRRYHGVGRRTRGSGAASRDRRAPDPARAPEPARPRDPRPATGPGPAAAAAAVASASTAAARRSWRPGGRSGSSSRPRLPRARPTDETTSA